MRRRLKNTDQLMSKLLEQALRAIESGNQVGIQKGFLLLGEIIGFNCLKNFEPDSAFPEVTEVKLKEAVLKQIQDSLIDWIGRHPDDPSVVSAFCALNKFHDD